jgi:hypothetical protein
MNVIVGYPNEQCLHKSNFRLRAKIPGASRKQLFASGNFFASRKSMTTWHERQAPVAGRPAGGIVRKV